MRPSAQCHHVAFHARSGANSKDRCLQQEAGSVTYTFVTMEVSQSAYDEIRRNLVDAGYKHALTSDSDNAEIINMHGIALVRTPRSEPQRRPT
jgi:hypothetical protein